MGRDKRCVRHDAGEFGSQQADVGSEEEQGDAQALLSELIAVAVRNPFNDSVKTEAT